MSLTVSAFLEFTSMKKATLIAGSRCVENEIINIMVIEDPDFSKWLKSGYLLLTSFFAMKGASDNELESIVKKLVSYRCAGLIIKIDRLILGVPQILVESCEKYGLPLIKIPEDVTYSDIQVDVMSELLNKKASLLEYYYSVHTQFTKLSLKQPTVMDVLNFLLEIIGTQCALLNAHKNVIYTTDERLNNINIVKKESNTSKILFDYEYYLVRIDQSTEVYKQVIIKIPLINKSKQYYLSIIDLKGVISEKSHMAIENAVNFLQMLLVQRAAVANIKQTYLNDLMDDLLSEKSDSPEHLETLLTKLRIKADHNSLFHVTTIYLMLPDNSTSDLKILLEDFAENIKIKWPNSAYRIRENRLIVLLPSLSLSLVDIKKKLEDDIIAILKSISKEKVMYKAGVSDPSTVKLLQTPTAQSRKIVKRVMLQNNKSFVASSDDIGFYKFFTHISKDVELINLVPGRLIYLQQHHKDLFQTLRVFLDTNQHIKETAKLLSLHTKTVRYRIDRILVITNINFSDSEEVLQYNIGFRVMEIL